MTFLFGVFTILMVYFVLSLSTLDQITYHIKVFSCEFCKISKNTFSYRTFPVAASVEKIMQLKLEQVIISERHVLNGQMYSFLQLFCFNGNLMCIYVLHSAVTNFVFVRMITKPL